MAKMCRRLSAVERVRIKLGLRDGLSLTRIAEAIGRPKGTVSKEIARHGGGGAYAADAAHIQSVGVLRGGRPNRLKPGKPVFEAVAALLRQRWSPEQISGRRKRMEDDGEASSGLAVSHEAIYQTIHALPRGELKKELLTCLRQGKPHRGRRSKADEKRGKIRDMTSIHERPAEIQGRLVPGHWEGDLIKGAGNRSSIGTLVQRQAGAGQAHRRRDHMQRLRRGPAARPGSRAPNDDLRQGDGPPQGTCHRHLLRRPARTLAAGLQREHQRIAAAVPPEGG